MNGLIVSAPGTGSGKTTVMLGLLRWLRREGRAVRAFKVGTDFIDPAFHEAAFGERSHNVDTWAMRPATVASVLGSADGEPSMGLAEGVMGLFDGGPDGRGSAAHLAKITGWPAVLVVDAWTMGASAAAVVHGFATFDREVAVAGVIYNRVAGAGHADILRRASAGLDLPVLGCLLHEPDITLPERHLGLVLPSEQPDLEQVLDTAADRIARDVDVEALLRLAGPSATEQSAAPSPAIRPMGQRIAVASDLAFSFAYPHVLAGWRRAGVQILPFSPLANEPPAAAADAVYLPGGYPELHAGRLAENQRFRSGMRSARDRGAVIYGECGGYMTLGEGLVDRDGARHAMCGLLPVETSFAEPAMSIGYRRVQLAANCSLGALGIWSRAHEFHFATELARAGEPLFHATDAEGGPVGSIGCRIGSVMGSFAHLVDLEEE